MKTHHRWTLPLLCLLLCVYADYELGIDRPYGDLPNQPIQLDKNAEPEDCQTLCEQNSDCKTWSFSSPKTSDCQDDALCWLKGELKPVSVNRCMYSGRVLKRLDFMPFPASSFRPTGWLMEQMKKQATGLAGHLADFWNDIANSTWIGGNSDTTFNGYGERVPYWINGLVPTAYLTGDQHTIDQVERYVKFILDHQTSDGFFGNDGDPWPRWKIVVDGETEISTRFPLLMALTQYSEFNPSHSQRVIDAIWKYFDAQRAQLFTKPLDSWAKYRYQDLLLSIFYIYDHHPRDRQEFLLNFAELVYQQRFDWEGFFGGNDFPKTSCTPEQIGLATHGVNVGQGLKSSALWYRYSQSPADISSTTQRYDVLDRYHGMASGIFSCSEHLAGLSPSQGAETCTVVETMFSYVHMYSQTRDVRYADRIEQLAYNALPASMTPDTWAHVYLQQANEISSEPVNPFVYLSDGADANVYGLAPWFGCCTANFVQGWPKFVTHALLQTEDDGVAVNVLTPLRFKSQLANGAVSIIITTNYPFEEIITFDITSEAGFPFYLRIPAWANNATLYSQGKSRNPPAGKLYKMKIPAGKVTLTLQLPMEFRTVERLNGAVAIYRGPFLYSLDIGENMEQKTHYYQNSYDYVTKATKPWAYALSLDPTHPENSLKFTYAGNIGENPFDHAGTPLRVAVRGKKIEWGIEKNAAADPPKSPVESSSAMEDLTLLPFGSSRLRMTELPVLKN
ncbi:hypothetical protein PROFUN_02815 [Planoprotostelium fungivorum]|uniref:Uncharacterized protein n=1 Tax=Planoprotostelium fungivorum TaxID=1890364 RepID=A0A2P6NXQ1_9EUKA|nr:hypothetical protein PROFUN_02815 [Planoprotostelium fungivorum]